MPEVLILLVIVFILAPVARAVGRGIERSVEKRPVGTDVEVKKALQATEQRLSDSETRIAALEERVDFYEKLLANPNAPTSSSVPAPPSRPQ